VKIERGVVWFWKRREMGLLCCGLKIERKWEKIGCGLKGKWSPG
jgi:hypothetical protein